MRTDDNTLLKTIAYDVVECLDYYKDNPNKETKVYALLGVLGNFESKRLVHHWGLRFDCHHKDVVYVDVQFEEACNSYLLRFLPNGSVECYLQEFAECPNLIWVAGGYAK